MKFLCLLLPALLLWGCTMSSDAYYQQAQLYLGSDDYATAADMFSQLGEYADAANYSLYCQGLEAMAQGQWEIAKADMALIEPFKSSTRYLQYITACQQEETGDLSQALSGFAALGSFEDSAERAAALKEEIPRQQLVRARALMDASHWAQAASILESLTGYENGAELLEECCEMLQREAYDQAASLYDSGRYEEAMAAFEALGDALGADIRARMCRSAMYCQLEEEYSAATMATAPDLIARYAEMEDYLASPLRLQSLQERFAVNLLLAQAEKPYVLFASRLWQVQQVEDAAALLELVFPQDALATDPLPTLSSVEDAAVLAYEYPRLTLDLNRFAFTQGSGTAKDPYQ